MLPVQHLLFSGWVPPGVHDDGCVGTSERDAHAACLQGAEEHPAAAVLSLKVVDHPLPLGRRAAGQRQRFVMCCSACCLPAV